MSIANGHLQLQSNLKFQWAIGSSALDFLYPIDWLILLLQDISNELQELLFGICWR
jgi:hypothetical protein